VFVPLTRVSFTFTDINRAGDIIWSDGHPAVYKISYATGDRARPEDDRVTGGFVRGGGEIATREDTCLVCRVGVISHE